jgi:hypothetical protein
MRVDQGTPYFAAPTAALIIRSNTPAAHQQKQNELVIILGMWFKKTLIFYWIDVI